MKQQLNINHKFEISVEAVPEHELDEYLEGHFSRLPEDQVNILPYKRE